MSGGQTTTTTAGAVRRPARGLDWGLRILTAAALAVDAWVHLRLAPTFDPIRATVSQGDLFRAEAAAAALALVLILAVSHRLTWLWAFLVLAAGFAAVMFYDVVDPGQIGPLPDMYDPQWSISKAISAAAEGAGAVVALVGLLLARRGRPAAARR